MLNKEEIVANKKRIINRLNQVSRIGIDELIKYLKKSDFFTAPCSTRFHLAYEGGLAEHSLNVYDLLRMKVKKYKIDPILKDSVTICGLLHDVCKIWFYIKEIKYVKEKGKWQEKEIWVVKDQLPLGHGEKSLSIIQDYIHLLPVEKLAIRWHMVAFDPGIHFDYPSGYAFREASKHPLVTLLFTADYEASQILEREEKEEKKKL